MIDLIDNCALQNEQRAGLNNAFNEVKITLGTNKFILAGGCVRDIVNGDEPKDLDVFFLDEDSYLQACAEADYTCVLLKQRKHSRIYRNRRGTLMDLVFPEAIHELNTHVSFSPVEDLPTGYDIIKDFDFADCQQFFDGSEYCLTMLCSVAMERKEIIINTIQFPYISLGRASKMKSRGWNISEDTKTALVEYCLKAPCGPGSEAEYHF